LPAVSHAARSPQRARDSSASLCDEWSMPTLNAAQIKQSLRALPAWTRRGAAISRTYVYQDFPAAIRFVNKVARLAEKAGHHPDMDICWNKVTLTLSTHDEGGLTAKDFALAQQCDQL
jgi:4a-hydroxytetrahydrobiopterin dehydratase